MQLTTTAITSLSLKFVVGRPDLVYFWGQYPGLPDEWNGVGWVADYTFSVDGRPMSLRALLDWVSGPCQIKAEVDMGDYSRVVAVRFTTTPLPALEDVTRG